LWAEDINAKGGLWVNGVRHPIELPRGDDQGLPEVARTVAERLINKDKVKFIIGPNIDTTYTAVREVCNPEKVIHFGATFDPSNVGPDKPYSVLIMWMAHQTGPILYKYLKEKHGVKKMAWIQKDDPGGRMALEKCMKSAKAMGIEVLDSAFYAQGTTDMYPQATKVLKGNPDVVDLPTASPEEVGLAAKALRELGFKGMITEETEGDPEVTTGIAGAEYAEGIIFNAGSFDPVHASPEMKEYHEKYVKKFGVWNPDAPTKLYTSYMMGAAIQQAGTIDDTDAVMKAFRAIQVKTPYLPGDEVIRAISQKEFGINNQIGVPMCLAQIQKGKSVLVYTHLAPKEQGITYTEPYKFVW
jgi:branched-chain amino acid transport system substrate-binding protein